MHFIYLPTLLLLLADATPAVAKQPPKNAILLSQVQTLTLRGNGAKTTHRRLPAVPQLKCLSSPKLCRLYDIDLLRCTNQGSGYDGEDIQWSCTANLPAELKLGSTDVICEGYGSSDDPYVLKGSCGVEYRLVLTKEGERKYPDIAHGTSGWFGEDYDTRQKSTMSGYLFAIIFFAVFAWIVYAACVAQERNRGMGGRRRGGGGGGGWGGGWGGGGGGGWQPWNDPPPPYPGTKPSWSAQNEGWRPGFWSGVASGAAGGYYAGSRRNNRDPGYRTRGRGWDDSDAGPSGTSGWGSGSSGTNTRESTGFGSTSRR